jgi:peroxiredoxin
MTQKLPAPGERTAALSLPTLDAGQFDLDRTEAKTGTLLVFYRGKHCPICAKQLGELEQKLDQFGELGVDVVAISADPEEKAREMARDVGIENLVIAHSLPLKEAQENWGLYISSAREGSQEPDLFSEPGIFFVTPGRELYGAWIQSTPFARPQIDDLIGLVRFREEKQYPPRGTYSGTL